MNWKSMSQVAMYKKRMQYHPQASGSWNRPSNTTNSGNQVRLENRAQSPKTNQHIPARSELQRFQRRQTSGVTIVSESDLLENESRAWVLLNSTSTVEREHILRSLIIHHFWQLYLSISYFLCKVSNGSYVTMLRLYLFGSWTIELKNKWVLNSLKV